MNQKIVLKIILKKTFVSYSLLLFISYSIKIKRSDVFFVHLQANEQISMFRSRTFEVNAKN